MASVALGKIKTQSQFYFSKRFNSSLVPPEAPIQQLSEFSAFGLSKTHPVGLIQQALESIHSTTGIPWWATIISATVLLRVSLFPLSVSTVKGSTWSVIHKDKIQSLTLAYQQAKKEKDDKLSQEKMKDLSEIFAKYKCSPFSILLGGLIPAPFYISTFFAIKGIAAANIPSWVQGGALWFTNLCSKDPFYVLPLISSGLMFTLIESSLKQNKQMPLMLANFLRILVLSSIPLLSTLPSGLMLYFITSNILMMVQNRLWKNQKFRDLFKIPPMPVVVVAGESNPSLYEQIRDLLKKFNEKKDTNKISELQKAILERSKAQPISRIKENPSNFIVGKGSKSTAVHKTDPVVKERLYVNPNR